jgi:cysteine-rich repeat protein
MHNATFIQLGAPTAGNLERGGDEDFFRFMVLEAGWYRIFTRGETDTFCHLLNQAGEEITRDDDSGERMNCRIERELQAGLYGIRLRHFSARGTGAYTLHVEGPVDGPVEPEPQCGNGRLEEGEECDDGNPFPGDGCDQNCRREEEPPPEDDHSNSGADATEIAINERLDGHLERVGDVDYFVVTSAQNQRLLVGTLGSTDTRCQAELVQGDVIALDSDSGPGSNCRMNFSLSANRPVYLRIEDERDAVRGEYTLFVAVE